MLLGINPFPKDLRKNLALLLVSVAVKVLDNQIETVHVSQDKKGKQEPFFSERRKQFSETKEDLQD